MESIAKELGRDIRGFKWPQGVGFEPANQQHFETFYQWDGEIYVKGKGLMTYRDYYGLLIDDGFCLFIDGYIVAKKGYSQHYNSLHKVFLQYQRRESGQAKYPLKEVQTEAIFEAAIELFRHGVISQHKLWERVITYIKDEYQKVVFDEIICHKPEKAIS